MQQSNPFGLTRVDAEIMAHDRLNPGFGLTRAAEAGRLADARDATIMRALTSRAGKCGMDPRHCPACRQTRAFIGL